MPLGQGRADVEGEWLGGDPVGSEGEFKGRGAQRLAKFSAGDFEVRNLDGAGENGLLERSGHFDVGGDGALRLVGRLDRETEGFVIRAPSTVPALASIRPVKAAVTSPIFASS